MAVKRIEGTMDVVTAARQRILNIFGNGVPVYMSFSAGKDSLCMSHLIYELILAGKIDARQLVVIFIDEEAIYDSMYQMAVRWRKRFMAVGAEFRWYCLPVKQSSVLCYLQSTESWITWEPGKEDCWVRQPPPFAITRSPYLTYPGEMNYQDFCQTITRDGIQVIGLRGSESLQRARLLATTALGRGAITKSNGQYPIYDWRDSDVWLYIREHNLDFPDAYIHLFQVGVAKRNLRLCNFFGSEGIVGLRYIAETDPVLWRQIEKREPNAYLTLLYWDSEMFKRRTRNRRELEGIDPARDYRAECKKMIFEEPGKYFPIASMKRARHAYRSFYIKHSGVMTNEHFRIMHDAIIAGDPKLRTLRSLYTTVYTEYANLSSKSPPRKGGEAK